jgi:hypothetical protein
MKNVVKFALVAISFLRHEIIIAQPTLETGGQKMPNEWIDRDTKA